MFHAGIPFAEKVLRTVLVYALILILLRLAGKRELAQVNTFDLVVMLLLSNVVQNAVIGPDDSVTGAAVGAAVLIAVNAALIRVTSRFGRLERLLEGTGTVLARDGRWLTRAIKRVGLRPADLNVAVRRQGGDDVAETSTVSLEPGGSLLVRLREQDQTADKADIARLNAALADLRRLIEERTLPPLGTGPAGAERGKRD
ncbi:YetF domain-containing protein [Streptomyces sp. SID3343]|uniref:DUF421 domain-containing protein n=1 Tax=Streptomyces sp. SID3343 TaxID=2690260 RepID=UPI001F311154|nr:YetF domain-containing protein [Streptomyces sp. SID3343]